MSSDAVFGALAALLGAALGAGGSIGAAVATARGQGRVGHAQWRRQLRREAYSNLMSRCFEWRRCAATMLKELAHQLVSQQRTEELLNTLESALASTVEAAIIVDLEGPADLGEIVHRIVDLQKESFSRLFADAYGEGPITDSFVGEELTEQLLGAEREFRVRARKELDSVGR
jgi:hypothetical protein